MIQLAQKLVQFSMILQISSISPTTIMEWNKPEWVLFKYNYLRYVKGVAMYKLPPPNAIPLPIECNTSLPRNQM